MRISKVYWDLLRNAVVDAGEWEDISFLEKRVATFQEWLAEARVERKVAYRARYSRGFKQSSTIKVRKFERLEALAIEALNDARSLSWPEYRARHHVTRRIFSGMSAAAVQS